MEFKIISHTVTVECNGDQYLMSHENAMKLRGAVKEYNRIQALRDNDFRMVALRAANDVIDELLECSFHVHDQATTITFNCADSQSVIDDVLQLVDSACMEVHRG